MLLLAVPFVLLITGGLAEYAIAFLSILLHESGHIAVAAVFGCRPVSLRIMPVGLSALLNVDSCRRLKRIAVYSAGPVINLLVLLAAVLSSSAMPEKPGLPDRIAAVNGYLALFNLIPAFPLDGGRILLELLSERLGLLAAGRLVGRLALGAAVIISAAGILQFLASGANFSLLIIGLFLLLQWKNGKMESAFMNIRQIIYRHSRLMKKGIYPARDLVAIRSTRLDEVLSGMDFDRFHFIYVLDDDLKLIRIYTEAEIMEAISQGGIRTLGQLTDSSPG